MSDKHHRTAKRDMDSSGIGKILELFFGGNQKVNAAVLFDNTGETVDYHTVLDPFETRLAAAYCGILFESARYRMAWLEQAVLQVLEFTGENFDVVIVPVCEIFFLAVLAEPGTADESLLDTIEGVREALIQEIG